MYECGMTGKYPANSAVKAGNVTAEMLANEKHLSACKAYTSLLNLMLNV